MVKYLICVDFEKIFVMRVEFCRENLIVWNFAPKLFDFFAGV